MLLFHLSLWPPHSPSHEEKESLVAQIALNLLCSAGWRCLILQLLPPMCSECLITSGLCGVRTKPGALWCRASTVPTGLHSQPLFLPPSFSPLLLLPQSLVSWTWYLCFRPTVCPYICFDAEKSTGKIFHLWLHLHVFITSCSYS